jgi:4-amino-4-deoxy-L-arabinose transferase-like glycosyltransferase
VTEVQATRQHDAAHAVPSTAADRMRRLLRGPDSTPDWYRPVLLALLLGTAALYLWNLSASGDANSFYTAAVQAGTESWKAFFFGSIDKANFITVDKPPASLWPMELSGRIFGFSSWSMLVPDALEGVATVALVAATVRRALGSTAGRPGAAAAGLIAAAVTALTPAAVLIFRFNNPDALMVLLIVVAAYFVTRAVQDGKVRWLIYAGIAFGFGFLTKSGEALLPLPVFALAYLVAGPVSFWRRIRQLLLAGVALVVSAGWWIVAVLLTPAADRPYIGGSTNNNPLELALGYNGLGRLFGETGGGGGGGGGAPEGSASSTTGAAGGGFGGGGGGGGGGNSSFGGATGLGRLFRGEFGYEISWLLPAALILIAALVWLTWRGKRTDPARAALIIWGGWLLVMGGTFSYMSGTVHPYYSVGLAPPIGALAGIGAVLLWQRRGDPASTAGRIAASAILGVTVLITCAWDVKELRSDSSFHPSAAVITIAASAVAIVALAVIAIRTRAGRRLTAAAAIVTGISLVVPTAAWALGTAATPHTGSIPTAVSSSGSGSGSGFGGGTAAGQGSTGSGAPSGRTSGSGGPSGGGAPSGGTGTGTGGTSGSDSALLKALEKTTTRWAAAVVGDQDAASLELASGGKMAVMGMGGFTGSDTVPTLAQFEAYVKAGDITYYIASSQSGGIGGGSFSAITQWVEKHFKSETIGGTTVYVLHST